MRPQTNNRLASALEGLITWIDGAPVSLFGNLGAKSPVPAFADPLTSDHPRPGRS
jgi:hypothetical protein